MEEGRADRSYITKQVINAAGLASTDVFFSFWGKEKREARNLSVHYTGFLRFAKLITWNNPILTVTYQIQPNITRYNQIQSSSKELGRLLLLPLFPSPPPPSQCWTKLKFLCAHLFCYNPRFSKRGNYRFWTLKWTANLPKTPTQTQNSNTVILMFTNLTSHVISFHTCSISFMVHSITTE